MNNERQEHPVRAAVLDPVPRVVQTRELRKQVVQGGDRGDQEAAEHEHVAGRELEPRRGLDLVVLWLATGLERRARRLVERSAPPGGRVPHARARASAAWTAADSRRAERRQGRRSRAHTLGQREPRHEIDDVVLAQVDERDPEQHGVGPAERSRESARLGQHVRGRDGCREVQGGHGCQRVSPEDTVQRGPAGPPEVLAVLDHHPSQLRRPPVLHQALGRRVPGWRGRDRPVADESEVERRVDPRRPSGEPLGAAEQQVQHRAVGEREPEPVRPDEQLLPRLEAARGAERALQAQGRRHPAAEQPVGLHGVGDLHAPAERLGVVEGHLVPGHIGPHLEQARPRVTRARAGHEHAEGERGGRGGGEHDRRPQAEPAADERSRHTGCQHRHGGRADGGRAAHAGERSA